MNLRTIAHSYLLALAGAVPPAPLPAAEPMKVEPDVRWYYVEKHAVRKQAILRPRSEVLLQFKDEGGTFVNVILTLDAATAARLNSLRLQAKEKKDFDPVMLQLETLPGKRPLLTFSAPEDKGPADGDKFVLELPPDIWNRLRPEREPGELPMKIGRPLKLEVVAEVIKAQDTGLRFSNGLKLAPENFLSLLAGTGGKSVLSGKVGLVYDLPSSWSRDFHFHLDTSADVDFKDRKKFFNSVTANLLGAYDIGNINRVGFTAKVETDQGLHNVNATAGVAGRFYLLEKIYLGKPFTWFAELWQKHVWPERARPAGQDPWALAPVPRLTIGYDFVGKVATGTGADARRTSTGEHRLSADFFWTVWLARGLPLRDVKLFGYDYRLGLVIDVGAKYDLEKTKFLPTEQISLVFTPEGTPNTPTPKGFSLTLTYANGKATPTFKNVNSLLAGLGYRF